MMLPSDMDYVEGLKLRTSELQREILAIETCIREIYESGEWYSGEINKHLTELELKKTQAEFASYAAAILETNNLPERIVADVARKSGAVDDLMIEQARAYPIEKLLEGKRGRARCINPEHTDKRPSMDIRNNFCYCYACGFTADSIKTYMILKSCNFIDAVKALNV